MEASLSLLAVLNLLGSAQALLLALALLGIRREEDGAANRVLAALVVVMAIIIAGSVLRTTHYEFVFPHLSRVHDSFVFLGGPLLFLYLRTLVRRERRLARRDYLHFLPFAACVLYLSPYYLSSRGFKLDYMLAEFNHPTLGDWYYVRSALLLFQCAVYLTLAGALLFSYARKLKGEARPPTHAERAMLFQIRFMLVGFLILFAGALLRYTLDQTANTNLLVPLGVSVLIYALGYLSLRRPEMLTGVKETPQPAAAFGTNAGAANGEGDILPAKKYEKSTLTPERAERYLKRLLRHMDTEKPYIDGELTLPKLAERLSIPAPHLSQTINERLRQNFFDFVNTYRIEEAKRRLLDPAKQHYSVLAIAEEVGFNSKSSFNAVFKKHVLMTPSEFRKRMKPEG